MDSKMVGIGTAIGGGIFLVSWLSWQDFVVDYLRLPSCTMFQWAGAWGLVLTVLTLICLTVEVLRDRR